MSAHRLLAPAALLASIAVAGEAGAQYVQARGVFAANVMGTDNVQFVPMNPPGANPARPTPAFVLDMTPAAVLSYETPRWLHELQYTLNFATVIGIGQQLNYTNRLEVRSRYDVSEITRANLALRLNQGGLTFFPEQEPGQPVAAFAPGTFTFVTVEVAEAVNHRLGERLALTEALTLNAFRPVESEQARPGVWGANFQAALAYADDPENFNVNIGSQLGVTEELDCRDVPCGEGRICSYVTGRCELDPALAPPRAAAIAAQANPAILTNRIGVGYRRAFENGVNADFNLGVQQAMRLTDGDDLGWQPVGRIALQYQREEAAIQLTLNHGAQLNPNVGGLVMATNADLVGNIPIDRQTRNWAVTIQTGYQRGTPFDPLGALLPGFHVAAADVGLGYRPERWLPNLVAGVRYQFRTQITEAPVGAGQPRVPVDLITMRHAVTFNVGFEFPERKQGP